MEDLRMTIDSIIEKKRISILIGIITLTIILQLYNLGNKSLWLDEAWSFKFASMDLMEILASPDKPNPPLYYVILHFFLNFGQSEFILRLPSVISSILCIPLAYKLGMDFFDYRVGLLSAFLLGTSPCLYWYAQEARGYTLFILFSLLSIIFFYNALRKNDALLWIGFIASTSLGIYTHYFAFFLILIESLVMILYFNKYKPFLSRFLLSLLAILVFILPQILSLCLGMSLKLNEGVTWGMPPSVRFVPNVFIYLSIGEGYPWMFVVLPFFIFLYGIYNSYIENEEILRFSAIWIFIPILISFFLAFKINYQIRYFIFILPIYLTIISKGLIDIGKKRSSIFLVILLVFSLCNAYLLYENYDKPKEDWKSVASLINVSSLQDDKILSIPGGLLDPCLGYYGIDPNMIINIYPRGEEDLSKEVQRILPKTRRSWIPYSVQFYDGKNIFLSWLNRNCIKKGDFYDIKVYLWENNSSQHLRH
jgi:uncharacterized membrane protein